MNLKETYWKPGNILVMRGDKMKVSIAQREHYVIRDDGKAYPCNKQLDEWWRPLTEEMYDDKLQRMDVEDKIRSYWDVVSIYSPVDELLSMTQWTDGNILMTKGELFFSAFKNRALGLNNDGGWLEQTDFDVHYLDR